jgi:hypothetical protein
MRNMNERTQQIGLRIPLELLARVEAARLLGGAAARSRTDVLLAALERGLAALEAEREPSAQIAAMRAAVQAESQDPELLAGLEDELFVRGAFAALVSQRARRAERAPAPPEGDEDGPIIATVTPIRRPDPSELSHTVIGE